MWGPGAQGGFQNALAMGLQFGQMARQQKDARDQRNALAAFVTNPSDETAAAVAPFNPELAYKYGQDRRAAQAETELAGLRTAALQGDETALDALAKRSFDDWKTVNAEVKAEALRNAEVFGNAALDILQVPPGDQRRDRIITYAQQFPQNAEKINEIAYLPPNEQEAALRAVVAEAKMIGRLHDMENPQAFNVGPGEGRFERNPRTGEITTIVQPNYGQGPSFAPVQTGPTPAEIDAELRRRGVIR